MRESGFIIQLKNMLKPSKGKLAFFAVMVFVLILLPIYPIEVTEQVDENTNITRYTNEALAIIILNGFEYDVAYIEHVYHYPYGDMHYSANPLFLLAYAGLFFFAYIFSCYLAHRVNWKWKGNISPYSKNT